MFKHRTLLAALALIYQTTASADEPTAMECKRVPGMIAGPMVPTPDVAREIYLAVATGRGDKVLPTNVIKVIDDGGPWSVFQSSGQLFMRGAGRLR
jgi:hypothetical protein